MTEEIILYRSVSVPELIDIFKTGKVLGNSNRFNESDPRKWVFFGDAITPHIIHQGEEIQRQAVFALQSQDIQKKANAFDAKYAAFIEKTRQAAKVERELADKYWEARATKNASLIAKADTALQAAKQVCADMRIKNSAFQKKMQKMKLEYRAALKIEHEGIAFKQKSMPFTSAVIETHPMLGGLHYSHRHGGSGMGETDEYGFPSGEVTWNDITRIHLVKNREVIDTIFAFELGDVLKKAGML
jgi:hypothetical protein